MPFKLPVSVQIFLNLRVAFMLLMGFSSGLPLALTGSTLQAWLTVSGVDLRAIGILSLIGIPYTLKFFWSPLMDRFVPPWLGRRRGWILPLQTALLTTIATMGFMTPEHSLTMLASLALLTAVLSASQDIVIDAYRTDVLREAERGAGAGVFVTGYRIGMLASGALALILSDQVGWRATYLTMSALMAIGMAATLLAPEPEARTTVPRTLREATIGPLQDFFSRPAAISFLLLMVLYKLGDAYAGSITTAFLIRGVGFTPTDVGTINKGMGLIALIVGATFGGAFMVRLGLFRSLLFFGLLQAVSNLSFMLLALAGKSYPLLVFAVAFENLTGGMGTSAFVALLMALCNPRFTATQFALLSSVAALGRVFVSPSAGYVVEGFGWPLFFLITTFTAVPGLVLVISLRREIEGLKSKG